MNIKALILSSFSLFLSFVTNSPMVEKALSSSSDVGLVVSSAWYNFSRLSGLFFVASKRLISLFTTCDWISYCAGIVMWSSLSKNEANSSERVIFLGSFSI